VTAFSPERSISRFLRGHGIFWLSLILIVAVLLTTSRYRSNRFALEVDTGVVTLTAADTGLHPLDIQFSNPATFQLLNYEIVTTAATLPVAPTSASILRLRSDRLDLQNLLLMEGAEVTFVASPDLFDMRITGPASIDLMISGEVVNLTPPSGPSTSNLLQKPTVWKVHPASPDRTLRLVVNGAAPKFTLENQKIKRVNFTKSRPAGPDRRLPFRSEIGGGKIDLLDVDKSVSLRAGELVWLGDLSAIATQVSPKAPSIVPPGSASFNVAVVGEADLIGIGYPVAGNPDARPNRDLRPSILEYISSQHDVALAWGGLIAIVGALLKARQWARKQRQ